MLFEFEAPYDSQADVFRRRRQIQRPACKIVIVTVAYLSLNEHGSNHMLE